MATNISCDFPKFYCFNTAVGSGWISSTYFFLRQWGKEKSRKGSTGKCPCGIFFFYIPAKTCSGVLRQRAEPSVLSNGKSTENSIKPSALHWPLVCSHLSWFLWCDTHQLWGRLGTAGPVLDFSSEIWGTQVTHGVKPSGQMGIFDLLLDCSFAPQPSTEGAICSCCTSGSLELPTADGRGRKMTFWPGFSSPLCLWGRTKE